MAGKDWPFHHGHAPPWRKKSPRSRSFFLLSRIFLVVLSSRSYDDVKDDVTLLLMTWHITAVLKSCTVQLYYSNDGASWPRLRDAPASFLARPACRKRADVARDRQAHRRWGAAAGLVSTGKKSPFICHPSRLCSVGQLHKIWN